MARSQPRYLCTPGMCYLQVRQCTAKGELIAEGMLSSSLSRLPLQQNRRNQLANPGMSSYLCYKALRPLLLLLDYSELVLSGPAVLQYSHPITCSSTTQSRSALHRGFAVLAEIFACSWQSHKELFYSRQLNNNKSQECFCRIHVTESNLA